MINETVTNEAVNIWSQYISGNIIFSNGFNYFLSRENAFPMGYRYNIKKTKKTPLPGDRGVNNLT
ncbi:MAG: hypothetical protein CVU88_04125 [Firmicutes bacterium HGW-Firmicutes-13]|nr:MAG: hypothetical protein CVU88_04125 [Firmicutes bacterium HGW-Firmicutes-13]